MAVSITSVTPNTLDAKGGTKLTIEGNFADVLGREFFADFKNVAGDQRCLTGIPGRPTRILPLNDTTMVCYTPQLEPGLTYTFQIERTDASVLVVAATSFTVLPKQYDTLFFAYRASLPPTYRTGPRNPGLLERI